MYQERSVKSLVAFVLLKWKILIIGFVVGALLMGVFEYNEQNKKRNNPELSDEALEESYNEEMLEYTTIINDYNEKIKKKEKEKDSNQEYLQNSLLMNLDPYNVCTSIKVISIDLLDQEAMSKTYGAMTIPEEYLLGKILEMYSIYYDNIKYMNLPELNEIHPNVAQKYWKEMVSIYSSGSMIVIHAKAATAEEADRITDTLYQAIADQKEMIATASYEHDLIELNDFVSVELDTDLEKSQQERIERISTLVSEIEELQQMVENTRKPKKGQGYSLDQMKKSVITFVCIGAFAGVLLMAFLLALYCISSQLLISSKDGDECCHLPLIGTISVNRKKTSLSEKVVRERIWDSDEESIEYILESINVWIKEKEIVLASTLKPDEDDQKVIDLLAIALQGKGISNEVIWDAIHNYKYAPSVQNAKNVVLIEKAGITRLDDIRKVQECSEQFGGNIKGFVLIRHE